MAVNMILLTLCSKMLLKVNIYEDKSKIHSNKTSSAFPAHNSSSNTEGT